MITFSNGNIILNEYSNPEYLMPDELQTRFVIEQVVTQKTDYTDYDKMIMKDWEDRFLKALNIQKKDAIITKGVLRSSIDLGELVWEVGSSLKWG